MNTILHKLFLVSALAASAFPQVAAAQMTVPGPSYGLWPTGVDAAGTRIALGATDTRYEVQVSTAPGFVQPIHEFNNFCGSCGGVWLEHPSATPATDSAALTHPAFVRTAAATSRRFDWRTNFTLPAGIPAAGVSLSYTVGWDDQALLANGTNGTQCNHAVWINGTPVSATVSGTNPYATTCVSTIPAGSFSAGANTVEWRIWNGSTYYGFRLRDPVFTVTIPVPTITTPAAGSTTTDTTPDITGTCIVGGTVTVGQGASTVCTAACVAGGSYTCAPSTPMSFGGQMITATQTVAGITSPATPVRNFTIVRCTDSSAMGTDSGCSMAAPHCRITGSGAPVCEPCLDSTASGTDLGCASGAPFCIAGSGGSNLCVACTSAADCNDSNPCTTDACTASNVCANAAVAMGAPGMCAAGLVCSGAPTNMCTANAPTITTPAESSVTASTTPAITGTCTAGGMVTLRQDASIVCTASCAAAGTYSCTPTSALTPGPQMITATQIVSGVMSPATPVRNFTVLGPPTITTPAEGAFTSPTPAITGTCATGSTVTVREGAAALCTAPCIAGAYTCTPTAPLAAGPHAITTTQTLSGVTSPASPVRNFVVAACMDTSATGTDMGCTAATPFCVGTGGAATCVACTTASHCNDSNACTTDSCSAAGACVFTAVSAGSPGMCTGGLVCSGAPTNMCIAPVPTISTPTEGSSTTNTTPDITGTCVAGGTVTVREGAISLCMATCRATGAYTCSLSAPLAVGPHAIVATQVVGGAMSAGSPVRNFSVVTCIDSAADASMDDGCSDTSPICAGSGTAAARCQPCLDSTTAATDLGCASTAPACVAGADGTNLCLPCEDSASENMLDNGCLAAAPICLTAASGARACAECIVDAHCAVGTVCNAANTCVPGCDMDDDCAATPETPVCNVPERECAECNVTADCSGTQTCEANQCEQPDSDMDGVPDDVDLDDDNDGIPDTRELPTGLSSDADDDGILDFQDPSAQPDGFDCMPNAAGVCTVLHVSVDFDQDGIPNHLDLDADGDGILDVIEAGGEAATDGTIIGFADMNGNGLADSVDAMPLPIPNTDGTDGPDFLDLDADGDGLFDSIEGGYRGELDAAGRPVGEDANDDGVIDALIGAGQLPTPDSDGDTRPDFQDTDDDGDGILTRFEAPDANGNGRPDDARDSDGDGTPDYLDTDDDGDGIRTRFEAPDANTDGNPSDARDTDGDGTPDYLDVDDDGDGLPTRDEMGDPNNDGNPDDAVDTDGDGVPDYLDPRGAPTPDAGMADAGRADGGLSMADAGAAPDAGSRVGGLAGGACGCAVNTTKSANGLLAMLSLLGLVVVRRRRRM